MAALGDLDGDGEHDLAVGAFGDDDGGLNRGAVWILFGSSDGSVKSHRKISSTSGGFSGTLSNSDLFGSSLAQIPDLDADGVPDLAVGSPRDDEASLDGGAVWIIFMRSNGNVKSHQKITQDVGGFSGVLARDCQFGAAVASIADLDFDGVRDLAVGTPRDTVLPRENIGSVFILFQNSDGTVKSHRKISWSVSGFLGDLQTDDYFGQALAAAGDLDGDGVHDLAVGAYSDNSGSANRGAAWILYLQQDGTVKGYDKIPGAESDLDTKLQSGTRFGWSLGMRADTGVDGAFELAVGAPLDDGAGRTRGALWMLSLPGPTPSVSTSPSMTPSPSLSPSATPTSSVSSSLSPSATPTLSVTPTVSPTGSVTPSVSSSPSPSPVMFVAR